MKKEKRNQLFEFSFEAMPLASLRAIKGGAKKPTSGKAKDKDKDKDKDRDRDCDGDDK